MKQVDLILYIDRVGDKGLIHDEVSYIYKISRIIRKLQYATENSIIRILNEDLLDRDSSKYIIKQY